MTKLLRFLASSEAFAIRDELRGSEVAGDPLRLSNVLRKRLPADRARALAEQITLEPRAAKKLPLPAGMLFDTEALEQATSPGCAAWHASAAAAGAAVVDLGCGLGADTLAFLSVGHRVVAVERDPSRAFLAHRNVAVSGDADGCVVVRGDAARLPAHGDVLFVDPDRRVLGRRRASLAAASPSWGEVTALVPRFERTLVKAPPALPDEEIPEGASVEFLSEDGECKEALLRLGAAEARGRRAAVLLATGEMRVVDAVAPLRVAAGGTFLLDPDPALRRAGGVDVFAEEIGAARVSAESTYLFADADPGSPWTRAYRVLEVFPYRPKDLARRLAEDPPREIVVKQRGLRLEESEVRRPLPLRADGPVRVIVLFPRGKQRLACLCAPPDPR